MTPVDLLARLVELFPEFARYWEDWENYHREDDGSFTLHGTFAEFSSYFRANYEVFVPNQLSILGAFLSACMSDPTSELSDAANSCFLENVSGERFSHDFESYLEGLPLKRYSNWNNPDWKAWLERH